MMEYSCILQCGKNCKSTEIISAERWKQLEAKTKDWKGLDKFESIFESTQWEQGAEEFYMHHNCYLTLSSSRKLKQTLKRKEKENTETTSKGLEHCDENEEECPPSTPKRLRSSLGGPIHSKDKCIWCMIGADSKHPNRKTGKLFRISTKSGWREFRRHTIYVKEDLLRVRLSKLIETTSDAFAADIMYHHSYWMKHITNSQIDADEAMHLQNVTYSEMKHIFFKKIDQIIFEEHEIRSLQSLLQEYKQVAAEYGFSVGNLKSSYVKELLIKEYGDSIGFHERPERNKSEFIYDTNGRGNYVEAAFNSFGITDEQLFLNLAPRLGEHIKETPPLNSNLIQTNHAQIRKQSSVAEAFEASIQSHNAPSSSSNHIL